jgi:nicotianamine synthase
MKIYNSFPYLDQYRQLARMELNTIDTALGEQGLPPVRKIAFLGSGPTPLTSICFRERLGPDVAILNIDRDQSAISLASNLVRKCGYLNISFVLAEIGSAELPDLSEYDVVHFAALIGSTMEDKRNLLLHVARAMRPGALMLLRSTDCLRSILYPRLDIDSGDVLRRITPVVATQYFGGATSLTEITASVDRCGENE